ncbi:O-antigen translocase [Synechococcus sp. CS-1326]|nr:O-antigen translocase [Synechococcus sp. CS-1326]
MSMKPPSSPGDGISAEAQESRSPATDNSLGGVFKASALIGSSALMGAALGALRAKTLAVLLGPAGIGLMGTFTMVQELARSMAQLGMTQSGVRQVAEAASTGDDQRLALVALVLRRITILCGFLGAIALWASSGAVSTLTFGTKEQATSISLLALALFLTVVADGRGALLQGMRRMKAVAKLSVFGALLGTIATVVLVYFLRERAIVPSLVAAAMAYLGLAWWFSRGIGKAVVVPKAGEVARETALLFNLGLAFLASGLLMSGSDYVVRTFIIRMEGIENAGLYQAAWTVGGLYVGFVLQAVAMDFYPRLVGVVNDHHVCNATVNEQTTVSMLMAAPGIIATITFAPLAIHLFYSAKFFGSIVLLQWICMGMAIRIIVTPMRFIIIAMNRRLAFFAVEAAWATFNIAATWWGLHAFGLEGAAIAFLLTNVFQALFVYLLAHNMTGFQWSAENRRTGSYFLLACLMTFVLQKTLSQWPALAVGTIITLASLLLCVRTTLRLTGMGSISNSLSGIMRSSRKD